MSEPIFGIDFGTTNSCLAVMETGGPRIVEIDGEPIVPSVVSFDGASGEVIVGRRALNRLVLEPQNTVRSIKRKMGETEPLEVAGRSLLPEEIAAEILGYLKRQGEATLGRKIERAVVTVPAYFDDAQRRATIRAGEIAGLEVTRIINEPTAAALVYGRLRTRAIGGEADGESSPSKGTERILVYDLGGGTFDVSVMELSGEIYGVLASCGDNHLGGDDFDELIAERLLDRACESAGARLATSPQTLARLREAAEQAKIDLSAKPYVRIMEEALFNRRHLDTELARDDFEEWVGPRLDASLSQVDEALEEAGMSAAGIDRVILVGGSTAIPRIRQSLEERFEAPVEHAVDPALCVALGAALQGAILAGEVFDQILVDVAAHSMGIKTLTIDQIRSAQDADHFACLIRRNTQIPATFSEVYWTIIDQQEVVSIEVYQGESPRCSDNTLIGEFEFDLEPAPPDCPIVIELGYDLDGIVRVVAEQKGYDNRREVTLDTRKLGAVPLEGIESEAKAVDNYMIRKARKLASSIEGAELRQRLESAATDYERALIEAADEGEVDRFEDQLLDLLEEAELELED